MRRRQFMMAAAATFASRPSGSARAKLDVRADGEVHPRVRTAIADLEAALERSAWRGDAILTVGIAPRYRPEEWEVTVNAGRASVRAGDARGLVYGISALRRQVDSERGLPANFSSGRAPAFPVRRWSTAVSHVFGAPWDERIHLADRFAWIKSEVLPRAADFGMNSVEINGRPDDGWDVDWIISFEKYPELGALFPPGERKRRLELVEDLAQHAHRNLLEIFSWSHELHLPPGFIDLYPQVAGTGYPVCLSNDFLKEFVRNKYIEFFTACPSVDGVVLSVTESGEFSLLTDAGCKCERCIRMSQHERLMSVLDEVIAAASRLRKQVVLRTFQSSWIKDLHGHPELETIRKAYTGVPPDIRIMSKYCPLDFYGAAIADEPLIGAFPNPHLVEFSLDVEWQGRTFVPVLTPENFQRRIRHAAAKKCDGAVARVDFPFPSMEPGAVFGHPNEFNAWFMGELLWDPGTDIGASLQRWVTERYGSAVAALASALRKTEEITQKTFFCLGHTLINYHNMIAGTSHADSSLWARALSKWDPSQRAVSEALFRPSEALIARARAEKQHAVRLAAGAVEEVRRVRGKLPQLEYERLRAWFEKLRDTAELWGFLTELYLRQRQLVSSPPQNDLVRDVLSQATPMNPLLASAGAALRKSVDMERVHGANSWPVVSPDRGVSAYQFVQEILRPYIAGLTGETAAWRPRFTYVDIVISEPVVEAGSVESAWRALVEFSRPGRPYGATSEVRLKWPELLRQVRLNSREMILEGKQGRVALPLADAVLETSLDPARGSVLELRKHVRHVSVSQREGLA